MSEGEDTRWTGEEGHDGQPVIVEVDQGEVVGEDFGSHEAAFYAAEAKRYREALERIAGVKPTMSGDANRIGIEEIARMARTALEGTDRG